MLVIVLLLGLTIGVFFGVRELAARRPGAAVLLQFDLSRVEAEKRGELWQGVLKAVGKRSGQLGGCRVSEVGPGKIRVRFPGKKAAEIAPAGAILTRRAILEFRLVHPEFAYLAKCPPAGGVPVGYEVATLAGVDATGRPEPRYFALKRIPEAGGDEIAEAYPAMDMYGHYEIRVRFTEAGGRHFAEVTGANVGRLLGIVLDGRLYSAPRINEHIGGGSAQITGAFTQREAIELSNLLGSPLPLEATFTVENEDGSLADIRTPPSAH